MTGKPIDGVVQALIEVAVGKVQHLYRGTCPDAIEGFDSRDPQCPACRVLTAAQQQGLRIVEPIRNCATPESREAAMVVLETDAEGNPTIWCDPEIADLVRALNVGGVRTKASCSGHGEKPFGIVSLQDGRELLVLPDWETTRRAERILDAGLSAQQQGQAVDLAPPSAPVGVEGLIAEWESDLAEDKRDGVAEVAIRIQEIRLDQLRALAQQPAAVDEAAAIRAFEEHFQASSDDPYFEGELELWLTAWRKALAAQRQEPKS